MDQREKWICRPEGRQRNVILREHCGYNERPEYWLPAASIVAGRWGDREYSNSCFLY